MSLKRKLALIMLLISSVPMLLLYGITSYTFLNQTKEASIAKSFSEAQEITQEIDAWIGLNLGVLNIMAQNPIIRSYNAEASKPVLVEAQELYPELLISLDNEKGEQISKSNNDALVKVEDRTFFKEAMSGEQEVVSEILISRSNNQLITVLATPVRSKKDGPIIGVLQASVQLKKISEFVTQKSNNGLTAYVIDREGKIMAHPNQDLVTQRQDMSEQAFVKKGLAGKSGSTELKGDNGQMMLVNYVYNDKTGWLICTEIPMNVVMAQSNRLNLLIIIIVAAALMGIGGVGFFFAHVSTKPIIALEAAARQIAEGNLNISMAKIRSKDEVGKLAKAFDTMAANLQELVGQINQNMHELTQASHEMLGICEQSTATSTQIAENIQEVARGSEETARNVEATSENMNGLDKAIQQVTAQAQSVAEKVRTAAEHADKGSEALNRVNVQMDSIRETVNDTADRVHVLGERSQAIGQIVEVISGIADQTNLLALNAAIEAARAGEQGRGFAVVAEEVRKLAEQSATAAKEIHDLIMGIQTETESAVQAMSKGTREVESGAIIVEEANHSFEAISCTIREAFGDVEEVSAAAEEMAAGGSEVLNSLSVIREFAQKSSAGTQNVAAATEEQVAAMEEMASFSNNLGKLADNLEAAVRRFRTE